MVRQHLSKATPSYGGFAEHHMVYQVVKTGEGTNNIGPSHKLSNFVFNCCLGESMS